MKEHRSVSTEKILSIYPEKAGSGNRTHGIKSESKQGDGGRTGEQIYQRADYYKPALPRNQGSCT